MKKNLLLLIIAIALCLSANLFSQTATPPANGDGTTANPYQIASLENLYWIAADALNWDKHYIQTANINAAETYTWFNAEGWISIGNSLTKFTGTYKGQDFTIDSLQINRTASYRGLFGYIENSTIENLNLTNVNILGGQYTGGLVGYSASSNIERVNVTGTVTSSNNYVGGLVGFVSNSNLHYITADCNVSGANFTGGLIGSLGGIINYSYSIGSVSGNDDVGGLVGYNGDGSIISNCYSHSSVDGNTNVGGLVGRNNTNRYPYPAHATVVQSFCTGQVTGNSNVGGFVGSIWDFRSSFFRCYWDTTNSGISTSAGGSEVIAKSTEELKQKATFENYNFYKLWNIVEGVDYPSFHDLSMYEQAQTLTINDLSGDGSINNPFIISNISELNAMRLNPSACYSLANDIDLSATIVWNKGFGWSPFNFTGVFNGNGYTLSNLAINMPTSSYIGLFADAGESTILNLNLEDVSVIGQYIACLAGKTDGANSLIQNVNVSGKVNGLSGTAAGLVGSLRQGFVNNSFADCSILSNGSSVGGLVGATDYGYISYSHSAGSVSGNEDVGGLVGYNGAGSIISNCYSHSKANGNAHIGGLVGRNNTNRYPYPSHATVVQSFCTGQVTGNSNVGGFVGSIWDFRSSFFRCYWDTTNSGISTSAGGSEVIAKSTEELKQKATFENYNFYKLWNIVEGVDYPSFHDLSMYEQAQTLTIDDLSGDGTIDNPYIISNISELNAMRLNPSACYSLANDIDLSATIVWNKGFGWSPFNFTGIFNGNGYTLSNLAINMPTSSYIGLFADAGEATILNLNLEDVSVIGGSYTACLAGKTDGANSLIQNVNVSGKVNGLSGTAAGLVGSLRQGFVINSFASCSIISNGSSVGGLVGATDYGYISYSHSAGSVSGNDDVGGLVGYNGAGSIISNSYSHSKANGNAHIGGLVGRNNTSRYPYPPNATVVQSYSTGQVTGNSNVSGFVGSIWDGGSSFFRCYWDTTNSGVSTSAGGSEVIAKSTEELKQKATFENYNFYKLWEINEGVDYPSFHDLSMYEQAQTLTINDLSGDGTVDNPYIISNISELNAMRLNPSACYSLANDIDLSATIVWNKGFGWSPFNFTGVFNGNGYTLSNLTINMPTSSYVGLFADAGEATILNLNLEDVSVIGRYIACLAGKADGANSLIQNVNVSGKVNGLSGTAAGLVGSLRSGTVKNSLANCSITSLSSSVGGLVGSTDYGHIYYSYSSGSVSGNDDVGGLVGYNGAGSIISNCYSHSRANGNAHIGGLVGRNNTSRYPYPPNATVVQSFSTGQVTGNSNSGGFVGSIWDGGSNFSSCYWDTESSGKNTSAGGSGVVGRSTEEMTYPYGIGTYSSWDFLSIWKEDLNYEHNNGYPYLTWQDSVVLEPPLLAFPQNNSIRVEINPYLAWETAENAISYSLQVSTDPDFTSMIYNLSEIHDTTYQIEDLEYLTDYYWRVRSHFRLQRSQWSDVWSFLTTNAPSSIICIEDQSVEVNNDNWTYTHIGTDWDAIGVDNCIYDNVKSEFNSNDEGWTCALPHDQNSTISWFATGGNPGGYIRYNESGEGLTDWFEAPAKFTGDKSSFYGGQIRYDLKTSGDPNTSNIDHLRLIGNGITLVATSALPNQNWQTYQVPLSAGSWRLLSDNSIASEEQILDVLSNLEKFNILADWINGSESVDLDNVEFIPGPATYLLTGASEGEGTTLNGVDFYPGETEVSWLFTDACGEQFFCNFIVTVESPVPAPLLALPENEAVMQPLNLALEWEAVDIASSYTLQLSTTLDFSSILVEESDIIGTSFEISGLLNSAEYFWRVRALSGLYLSNWSEVWSFGTEYNLNDGLIAYYPFNSNALDESGNFHHGTVFGATLTEDRFGNVNNAYSFNSANQDYIRVADHPQLRLNSQLTLSVWISHSSLATQYEDIVMKGNDSYGFQFNSNNAQVLFHLTSNGGKNLNSNFVPVTDEWCHLVGTYDGYVQKVFINGTLANSSVWSGAVQTNTEPLDFGFKVASDNNWYHGKIDDIRIYNRALTEEEIFALFNEEAAPVTVSSPNLISPENEALNQTLTPLLQWEAVENAVNYSLQVSTTMDFSSTVVNIVGITDTEYQLSDLAFNTQYFWRVSASDDSSTSYWSEVWSFTTERQEQYPAPVLVSPENNSTDLPLYPILVWEEFDLASSYTLQVSTNEDFTDFVLNESGIEEIEYQINDLEYSTTYFWRVKALSNEEESDWSEVWNFTTIDEESPLAAPVLIAPNNDAVNIELPVQFAWNAVQNATSYNMQIATDSDFEYIILNENEITDTSNQAADLTFYTQYFWRVKSLSNEEESDWSEVWNFTTVWGANEAEAVFAVGPNLNTARYGHHSAAIGDGRLVVFGGHGNGFVSLGSAEVWDPANPNTFTTLNMNYTHDMPTFVGLNDGRYLIAGGCSTIGIPAYATSEIYNPTDNTFSAVGNMVRFRASGGGAELSNGDVLIASAWWTHNTAHTYGELFNQDTQTFSAVGPFSIARSMAIVMPTNDGQAVLLGGSTPTGANLPSNMPIELFNPDNSSISTLQSSLFEGEDGWHISTRINYCKEQLMQDGRYLWMAYKTINNVTYRKLFTFDPETKTTAEFTTYPALPNSSIYNLSQPLLDYLRNTAHIFAVVPASGFPVCKVISVDLATGDLTISSNSYNFTYYFETASVLSDGRLFLTGGSANGTNFDLVNNTLFITPPLFDNNLQQINLNQGWNTISSIMNPDEPFVPTVFSEITNDIKIVKNAAGEMYDPAFDINTIGSWNNRHGYQVNMVNSNVLTIRGNEIVPEETPLNLANSWNLISYLRNSAMNPALALASVENTMLLCKNNEGGIYYPSFGINTLGNMKPGQGYWVYVNEAAELVYPSNSAQKAFAEESLTPLATRLIPIYKNTGSNATLILQFDRIENGAEVGVYNASDELIGSAAVHNGVAAVTIWGDDYMTDNIDGATDNELLTVKLLSNDRMKNLSLFNIKEITGSTELDNVIYQTNAIYLAKASVQSEAELSFSISCVPNPASAHTTFEYSIANEGNAVIEIYTLNGELIARVGSNYYTSGVYKLNFDASNLVNGVYNIVLSSSSKRVSSLMIINK